MGLFVASAGVSAREAHSEENGIGELSAYVATALPIVTAFEAALANSDRAEIDLLTSADFHVVERSDWETKLGFDALVAYIDGCEPAGRMSANIASITITHACKGYEYRSVLYNVKEGKVSRIVIGEKPPMQIRPAD